MNNMLISGAASGIGAATARLFHARGWRVGLLDVDEGALAALAAELGGAWYAPLDVVDAAAVQAAVAEFCAQGGGQLRLLFNAAGILRTGAFVDIELEQHTRLVQINVLGVLNLCHAAFAYLKATPGAQVINMGSASALYGVPQLASYSASKFAVRGLTEALELEWREYGIRVGDLMPPVRRHADGAQPGAASSGDAASGRTPGGRADRRSGLEAGSRQRRASPGGVAVRCAVQSWADHARLDQQAIDGLAQSLAVGLSWPVAAGRRLCHKGFLHDANPSFSDYSCVDGFSLAFCRAVVDTLAVDTSSTCSILGAAPSGCF